MEIFEIEGPNGLSGEIETRGAKNAATPILARFGYMKLFFAVNLTNIVIYRGGVCR